MNTLNAPSALISSPRALHVSLWIAQVLLAGSLGMAGFAKLVTPLPELAAMMPWSVDVPGLLVRFIGASEVLGALGLLLPAALRIRPRLTAWAAAGLATVMLLAAFFHLSRGEVGMIGPNAVLGGLAAFVAWGRAKKAPIAPRA